MGTLQNIDRKNLYGLVDDWVDDSFRKYCHFVVPSCKLELARFSALLRIQDGAECGNSCIFLLNPPVPCTNRLWSLTQGILSRNSEKITKPLPASMDYSFTEAGSRTSGSHYTRFCPAKRSSCLCRTV